MLEVLEVVVMLRVLDVDARLHLVDMKMLQLLEVMLEEMALARLRLQLEMAAILQQEVHCPIHGFDMTGIDLESSHS